MRGKGRTGFEDVYVKRRSQHKELQKRTGINPGSFHIIITTHYPSGEYPAGGSPKIPDQ